MPALRDQSAAIAGKARDNLALIAAAHRLKKLEGPHADQIRSAILRTIGRRTDSLENAMLKGVENRREELGRSTDVVNMGTLGLGSRIYKSELRQVGECSRAASMPPLWGHLLFHLIRALKPRSCLELGTAFGVSASFQASALKLNGEGHLTTLEGVFDLSRLSHETVAQLGLHDHVDIRLGKFADTLGPALTDVAPIDFGLIDGHHDEHATLAYFQQIATVAQSHAVLIFDDIHWSPGMTRAWNTIQTDPFVLFTIDLRKLGLCALR